MAEEASSSARGSMAQEEDSSDKGVRYLHKRIVVPMTVEHSNKKQAMHPPTMFCSYLTFVSGLCLRGLVADEFLPPTPGRRRYIAIKTLVHFSALFLVSLSFSLSLMMRMNVAGTSITLAAAGAYLAHRLWQCHATELKADVDAYRGCEEPLQQLLDLSANVTAMLFGGWFGMAFFYFQNNPEEARDARFLPSEYLTLFTSVGASLLLVKAVPRRMTRCPGPVKELTALTRVLVAGVVVTALVIAATKVRGYTVLALVPEAVAAAAWFFRRVKGPPAVGPVLPGPGGGGGGARAAAAKEKEEEPPSHAFVSVPLTLLLAVLTYRAKDIDQALSTLYDEAFVLVTTAAVVAALAWRLITQPPAPATATATAREHESAAKKAAKAADKAAAKVLAFSTFFLLVLSVLAFIGVLLGW